MDPGSGRRIVDTHASLAAYVAAAAERRAKQSVLRVHRLWRDPLDTLRWEIAPNLSGFKPSWTVTGVAASLLLAPYLSEVTALEPSVDAETMSDASDLAARLGSRIVDKGHRIEIRELPTAMSAHGPVVDGVHVALPIRVYADLMAAGGRSAEAAHHLRERFDVGTPA